MLNMKTVIKLLERIYNNKDTNLFTIKQNIN